MIVVLPSSSAEDQRVDRFRPFASPRLGGDEPLGRRDLSIDAAHLHLGAVGAAPDEVPRPAHPEIDLADGHRPAAGPSIQRGTCSGLVQASKTSSPRASKTPRHRDLPLGGRRTCKFRSSSSVHSPSLGAVTFLLPGLQLVEQGVEALEVALPEPAVALQPFVGLRERPPRAGRAVAARRGRARSARRAPAP